MFEVNPGQVEVWQAGLDESNEITARCASLLSSAERERAQRFVFDRDRRRWIIARAVLRQLLAAYIAVPPEKLEIQVGELGKPCVDRAPALEFNVSHSGDLAVFAFARAPVGIDVELLRSVSDALTIAQRFFSPEERQALAGYGSADRSSAFLRCWTRKEAFLKAPGVGLSLPLDSFAVSLEERSARLLRTDGPAKPFGHCVLADVPVRLGYVAAVGSLAGVSRIRVRDWHPDGVSGSTTSK